MRDVLTLQGEVADAILREVQAAVGPEHGRSVGLQLVAPKAYELSQSTLSLEPEESYAAGRDGRHPAVRADHSRDANFGQAYAGLAAAHQASGTTSTGVLPVAEIIPKALLPLPDGR